jgi:hypothetical protein
MLEHKRRKLDIESAPVARIAGPIVFPIRIATNGLFNPRRLRDRQ